MYVKVILVASVDVRVSRDTFPPVRGSYGTLLDCKVFAKSGKSQGIQLKSQREVDDKNRVESG